jgi:hypothetical protein
LLADYVDGDLPPSEATRVEEHLRACATCRQEVRLAAASRATLRSAPDPAPPAGLANAAIAEAERLAATRAPEVTPLRSSASQRPRPNTPRWLAIAGAAAVIALIALAVPKLGQPGSSQATFAAGASSAAHPPATTVEVHDVDYGPDIVARVAATFDGAAVTDAGSVEGAASTTGGPIPTLGGPEAATTLAPERLPAATRCLHRAYDNQGGTLTRVILARYNGQPAYLGVYLQSPGAGLEPNLVLVVVASVRGCDPLATGQFRLR